MNRKAIILVFGFSLAAVIVILILMPQDPYMARGPNPSPVTVNVGTNKGPVRVFPAYMGCFIIPPDGTLWRWGQPGGYGFSRANLPEQVGTNRGWVQAFAANNNCVGVSADGGFWSWGIDFAAPLVSSTPISNWNPLPKRVGAEHDWTCATSGGDHASVLKKDGTLWAWGHGSEGQLGDGLSAEETNLLQHPDAETIRCARHYMPGETNLDLLLAYVLRFRHVRSNLVQVGTNGGWTSINGEGSYTLALRADGTLWVWGKIERLLNGQPGGIFPVPTQICRETNWLAVQCDWTALALDRDGVLWRLFKSRPDASAPAASVGQLFASNCVPGRSAWPAGRGFCQLHPDGTLWETKMDLSRLPDCKPLNQWHRLGKRSDWISLCGIGTAYGVTADGTVWTWGTAWGQEGITTLPSKAHLWENQIRGWLGIALKAYSIGAAIPIQKEPRPLMRIVSF